MWSVDPDRQAILDAARAWWRKVLPALDCLRNNSHLRAEQDQWGLTEIAGAHDLPQFGAHGADAARWRISILTSVAGLDNGFDHRFHPQPLEDARRRLRRDEKGIPPRGRVITCRDLVLQQPIAFATYHVADTRGTPLVLKQLALRIDAGTSRALELDSLFAALVLLGHLHAIDAAIARVVGGAARTEGTIWYETDQASSEAGEMGFVKGSQNHPWRKNARATVFRHAIGYPIR